MENLTKQIEQAKGNAGLMHQVFHELEQQLEIKLGEFEKDHGKLTELKVLWDCCGHKSYEVVLEACQSVVNLTLKGRLGVSQSITALISNVSTAQHYSLLTDSVTEIMLRGSCTDMRHPFISLYEMQPFTWPYIVQQTSNIISCGEVNLQCLKQIKPFVLHILCCGPSETRASLWSLLIGKLSNANSSEILDWLLESLLWQNQSSDLARSNFFLTSVQQLCEYALNHCEQELGRMLAVLLTSAMVDCHQKYGFGIQHCVKLLMNLNSSFTLFLEPIVVMLSQFLLECHANCYDPLLILAEAFIQRNCNPFIWSMLQVSILSVFSYSPHIEERVVKIVDSSLKSARGFNSPQFFTNKYYHYLSRSQSNIQVAINTTKLAQHLEDNPKNVIFLRPKSSLVSSDSYFLLHCALFWYSNDLPALNEAVSYISTTKKYGNPLLSLLLKKLTINSNGKTKLSILYHLSALAVDKTCVPRVLHILDALSINQQMQPIRVKLLAELWKLEDRVYPYLEKMICSDHIQTDEFLIAKSSAIDTICNLRAEKYGADLLSVISNLLNSSLAKSSPNSASIATLALGSLVSLCRAEVVDLKSVWDLLAPKLNQDHRSSVVLEMCNLLALAPQLIVDNEDYDIFLRQTIAILFRISLSVADSTVVCAALRSLSNFRKEHFHLTSMPEICKEDLKVPAKYLPAGKTDVAMKAEDVLDYVPGICWIKLIDCYDAHVLENGYLPLLLNLVRLEIESMPLWIYRKAANEVTKKNEPPNYNTCLKEDSVLSAFIYSMQRICEINAASRLRMSVALKVLSGPYERPLPPLDWTVLHPVVQQYDMEEEFVEIIFCEIEHSFSAQSIAETILCNEKIDVKLGLVALSYLGQICKVVPLKHVQIFLCRMFNDHQKETLSILKRLVRSLSTKEPQIPQEVKQTITAGLADLLLIIPNEMEFMIQFSSCFSLVSTADFQFEATSSSAKNYVLVLLMASKESHNKSAIDYLYKALQVTIYLPGLDRQIKELIYECTELHCKTGPSFLQQFLSFVQLMAMKPPEQHQNLSILMDVLCLLVSAFAGSTIFELNPEKESKLIACGDLWEYFSLGSSLLFTQPQWNVAKKSVLDWILSMIDNRHLSADQKRNLFNVLPTLTGIDKETFLKIIVRL